MTESATPCAECRAAALGPHHGFRAQCVGCKARSVARSPQFFAASKAGKQTDAYRQLLRAAGVVHEDVKAASAADALGVS